MEVIAEVFLSAALECLVNKLVSSDIWNYAREKQVRSEMSKWQNKLSEVHKVLNDAENKQFTEDPVKAWLRDLRDLAYDMEDVLDEFDYHTRRRRLVAEADGDREGGSRSSALSKVRRFIPSAFTELTGVQNVKIGSKIREITRRLDEISTRKDGLGLVMMAAAISTTQSQSQFPSLINTSLVNKSEIYGRDDDKKFIIDKLLLLGDDPAPPADQTNFSVVSIVAMGGMGKTTLARLVFDDAKIDRHFKPKAWVHVSDQFDVVKVTKTILSSVLISSGRNSISTDSLDFHQSQEKLKEELNGQKFLLVLDNMWNDNPDDWYSLKAPFSSGAGGSKIIVTTRNRRVAETMGGVNNLRQLEKLSDKHCWLVFKTHSNIDDQSPFASTGMKIVEKCGGLPLAARSLGGLLLNEQRQEEWDAVLSSPFWELKSQVIPALRLSYNHLSPYLKRCFAYCAIFPKGYLFDKDELILLWMAEGLIQQSNKGKELEDLGDDYFLELGSKSFFQLSTSYTSRFVMHDLVHDLAKFVAQETCLHLDAELESDPQHTISESIRHASYISHQYGTYKRFEKFHKKSHLRTFATVPYAYSFMSDNVLKELIPGLEHLRVLSLCECSIREIPDSFGKLKHLRYLNLSRTLIQCLPDSMGNLLYLQTLKLSECVQLSKLPITIGNLINLRHLDVSGSLLEELPSQIGKLTDLRLLSNFKVGEDNGLNIRELSSLTNLRGELYISKLENVVNIEDARDAGLKFKHGLKSLIIEWAFEVDDVSGGKEKNHMDVLQSLQPHSNLEKLRIESFGSLAFPRWVSDASLLSKMVDLSLVYCKKCTSLPCLGQLPSLKRLLIKGMHGVKKVGAEFYGEKETSVLADKLFRSLESLCFISMWEWEHWEDWSSSTRSLFPCLHQLEIRICPKLIKNLPSYLPNLTKLLVYDCPKLEFPLVRFPSLHKLDVSGCNETVLRSGIAHHSLTALTIAKISGLVKLYQGFVQSLQGLQALTIGPWHELRCLWDDDDAFGLEHLPSHEIRHSHQLVSLGCNLRSLLIVNCVHLERLPNGWQSLACLEELEVNYCRNLVSFPEVGFPPNLRHLKLSCCEYLTSLPHGMMLTTSTDRSNDSNDLCLLESLDITECRSITCFPKGHLPITLKRLWVERCRNFSSLPEGMMLCALEDLSIFEVPLLTNFPEGGLPPTLKQLKIRGCENLQSLPEGIMHQHSSNTTTNSALRLLGISCCPSLTSFPEGQFPYEFERLGIVNCEQLEPISEELFHSANNLLQSLTIEGYHSLKTLPDCLSNLSEVLIRTCKNLEVRPHQFQNFTHLTTLHISHCENISTPLSQWGLSRLPSLKTLSFNTIFPDIISFPDDHLSGLLPTTLTSLNLENFQNLESLDSFSLHILLSLESVKISRCPKLRSILPRKKRFPATLASLCIYCCPLLTKRYSKEEGKDWPKIAHIPKVDIGGD